MLTTPTNFLPLLVISAIVSCFHYCSLDPNQIEEPSWILRPVHSPVFVSYFIETKNRLNPRESAFYIPKERRIEEILTDTNPVGSFEPLVGPPCGAPPPGQPRALVLRMWMKPTYPLVKALIDFMIEETKMLNSRYVPVGMSLEPSFSRENNGDKICYRIFYHPTTIQDPLQTDNDFHSFQLLRDLVGPYNNEGELEIANKQMVVQALNTGLPLSDRHLQCIARSIRSDIFSFGSFAFEITPGASDEQKSFTVCNLRHITRLYPGNYSTPMITSMRDSVDGQDRDTHVILVEPLLTVTIGTDVPLTNVSLRNFIGS